MRPSPKATEQHARPSADFDAKLHFDQNNATASTLEATINPRSLTVPSPPEGFLAELTGAQWLNTATYPSITFIFQRTI